MATAASHGISQLARLRDPASLLDDWCRGVASHLRGQEMSPRDIAARLATGKKKASTVTGDRDAHVLREYDEKTALVPV